MVVRGRLQEHGEDFPDRRGVYIAYIIAGVLSQPGLAYRAAGDGELPQSSVWSDKDYMYMAVGVVGHDDCAVDAVLSAVVDCGEGHPREAVQGVAAGRDCGLLFTDIVAWFIIVACAATLYVHGMRDIAVPADAAGAMKPLAGDFAFILFAAGLFNASLFAASILPLSTAYTVCEGLGLETGVDKGFKEAPFFYWLYTLLIVWARA